MKLAVLLTYYNEKTLLTECLSSLASQPEPPDEVLVYDDASVFPAQDFLLFPHPFSTLKIFRGEKNRGPAFGRNFLLEKTSAEYVHFQDSDDLFLPRWSSKIRETMVKSQPDCILTELRSTRYGKPWGDRFLNLKKLTEDPDLVRYCLANAVLPAAGSYKKKFLEKTGGYRLDLWQSEDYEFHIRLAMHQPKYAALTEPLVETRVRDESRSQKKHEVWECRLRALETLAPLLKSQYAAELADAFAVAGAELYRLGRKSQAKRAFMQSGGASFLSQSRWYRRAARTVGPEWAEWASGAYRSVFPQTVRRWVREEGADWFGKPSLRWVKEKR